ncbi:MAG: ribosome-associated heat shock protein Hsp15 [Gammaproteobacteria bacterium]|nr:ribosome-associated heat shock protein Hsp15 [Gammaproteobacteria bacterium]
MSDQHQAKVRLDKWLWAARFFKTRGLAKAAIEGGKVHYDGQRSKCSRMVEMGVEMTIRQGWDEKTVLVTGLSEQRRGATEAAKLYQETSASIAQRAEQAAARKAMGGAVSEHRPNKKQRREQSRFWQKFED